MRVLVTGAAGFVGRHLQPKLLRQGWEVLAAGHDVMDITDASSIRCVVRDFRPDAVVHLAAQSRVGASWELPVQTAEVNILGSIKLYTEFAQQNPRGRFLYIGSSDVYGITAKKENLLTEDMPCVPQNPYSISKLAAEQMLTQMAHKYQTTVICTRSFNHYGPGQDCGFVVSDFASQLAAIKLGYREPIISVGNLSAEREFLYVEDVADAYIMLLSQDTAEGIYNVSAGKAVGIEQILAELMRIAQTDVEIVVDEKKLRPVDVKSFCGSNARLAELGWQPQTLLQDGLEKTFEYWIRRCQEEHESGNCP